TVSGWLGTGSDGPLVYYPERPGAGEMLLVRVEGNAETERLALMHDLRETAPEAVDQVHSAREIIPTQVYPFPPARRIAAPLGAVALLLVVTGIYGVLSCLVAQRTREIGIRMALGAAGHDVVAMVLRQCAGVAAIGMTIGLAAALGASLLFASLLPMVN